MEEWISEGLEFYQKMHKEFSETETAISHCALSMAKILNGLSEMGYTQFHQYEKQILWGALRLFSGQCKEQINNAIKCEQVTEKKEMITDIEASISQIMEVCKNIFDGTANAERQMFQSLSVETNLYELSPKLCAFYSSILGKAVELFAENPKNYAFVIHPTLRSTIEAKLLLKERKESGRTVIVYISESLIEKFDVVPICLIHEAFHVITKERSRKERAKYFILHMLLYMEQYLFGKLPFSGERAEDVKRELMTKWFENTRTLGENIKARPQGDKSFYSKNIKREVCESIKRDLISLTINLEKSIVDVVCGQKKTGKFLDFKEDYELAEMLINQVRRSLNGILLENYVSRVAELLIFMYQETYADIACILALDLTPRQYENAFIRSIQFQYDRSRYHDMNREVREYLVSKAVSNARPGDENWSKHFQELEAQKQRQMQEQLESQPQREHKAEADMQEKYAAEKLQNGEISSGQINMDCDTMRVLTITEQALDIFHLYLNGCTQAFCGRIRMLNRLEGFRCFMKGVITDESSDTLIGILSEEKEEILEKV